MADASGISYLCSLAKNCVPVSRELLCCCFLASAVQGKSFLSMSDDFNSLAEFHVVARKAI